MKELSIEEKAKAYDEAIERTKELNNRENASTLLLGKSLEYIFPELKESEDEKTRKGLLRYLTNEMLGVAQLTPYTHQFEAWVAWLEKQKTSEEALQYLKENHSPSEISDFQNAMNIAVAKAYDKGMKDGLEKQKFADIDNKFLKMRETKPTNIVEFLGRLTTVEQEFLWEHVEKIKELVRKEKPESITDEWIEDYWQHEKVNNPYSYDKGEEIQFDHQGFVRFCTKYCKKPSEWSEKDENSLGDALWAIQQARTIAKDENDMRNLWFAENWLKSLKDRYTWKPSEEQLKALNYVVNLMASSESPKENDYYYNVFKDLRDQLKKLKEE